MFSELSVKRLSKVEGAIPSQFDVFVQCYACGGVKLLRTEIDGSRCAHCHGSVEVEIVTISNVKGKL